MVIRVRQRTAAPCSLAGRLVEQHPVKPHIRHGAGKRLEIDRLDDVAVGAEAVGRRDRASAPSRAMNTWLARLRALRARSVSSASCGLSSTSRISTSCCGLMGFLGVQSRRAPAARGDWKTAAEGCDACHQMSAAWAAHRRKRACGLFPRSQAVTTQAGARPSPGSRSLRPFRAQAASVGRRVRNTTTTLSAGVTRAQGGEDVDHDLNPLCGVRDT